MISVHSSFAPIKCIFIGCFDLRKSLACQTKVKEYVKEQLSQFGKI